MVRVPNSLPSWLVISFTLGKPWCKSRGWGCFLLSGQLVNEQLRYVILDVSNFPTDARTGTVGQGAAKFNFSILHHNDILNPAPSYIGGRFTGEAISLKCYGKLICGAVFHILVPIIRECFHPMKALIFRRKP
jgi:hypothetical protein